MCAQSTEEVLDVVQRQVISMCTSDQLQTTQRINRFRIVSVGGVRVLCLQRLTIIEQTAQAGVDKSSLINSVFQVNDASRILNPETPILSGKSGFKPTDLTTFNAVREFLLRRSDDSLELKDRVHAVWLCIQTPIARARVLETADEVFLKVAHKRKIPVVVVFTQYDLLVRKYTEDCENAATLEFDRCVKSLEDAVARLVIDKFPYINVTVPKDKRAGINIRELVEITRRTVEKHLQDVWIMWATAQQVDVPVKIEASIEGSTSDLSNPKLLPSVGFSAGFFVGALRDLDLGLGPGFFFPGLSTGILEDSDFDTSDTVRFLERV
ncbi:hypothetical protein B0H14DRAFT_2592480 [Mycena olivaceomarginata]|nr:hypothetical protein B0H14DRAFT_2592480 [Mycena olivaceomarginata]